jgi:choline dehydrogenase-like flavoprotein
VAILPPGVAAAEPADLCIVGAGPVGLALALACARGGLKVVALEAGLEKPSASDRGFFAAEILAPQRHPSLEFVSPHALGGASTWWGGRCVPFDDSDFEARAPRAAWPITHTDIAQWYEPACAFLGCGPASFSLPAPSLANLADVRSDGLERWTPARNVARSHRTEIEAAANLKLMLGAAAVGLLLEGDRVAGVEYATAGGDTGLARARCYAIAAGGVETTRLLLLTQRRASGLFGGEAGALGRYYAGHISGKIADIRFNEPSDAAAFDFLRDGSSFVRRRLRLTAEAQRREGLLNAAFWVDNPPFSDPGHGSALLSAVWMALAFEPLGSRLAPEAVRRAHVGQGPHAIGKHVFNVVRGLGGAFDLAQVLHGRYLSRPPRPGFLLHNRRGRYALHYHAEQSPNPSSRLRLSDARSAAGLPTLEIDFRYQDADVRSVLKSHALVDGALRAAGKGELIYRAEPLSALAEVVWAQAADGAHQTGTTRMGRDRTDSVVNGELRTHDLANLFIASSSVFPSSGQANPTLLAVALALRLADKLCRARD